MMVFTRGHRDDCDNKSALPVRECRKPRITLQEPEDDMFWESDENMVLVKKKTRSLGVTFQDSKIINLSLPNIRPGLLSRRKRDSISTKYKSVDSEEESEKDSASHLLNNQSDDLIGIEGDTDTDDDLYDGRVSSRLTQGLRNSKSRDCRLSPIKKEFIMNVDDELSEKSDHESGLRRSSRQKKFVSSDTSWLVENKKLRGYPNMMVQSSEPENEEPRPSRKTSRYLQSKKESTMSPPQPKSLRFRKQSNTLRSRGCVYLRERRSKRPLLQRERRRPMRLRESEDDEEERDDELEEEEEEERDEDEEDDKLGNDKTIENEVRKDMDESVNEIKEPRSRVGRRLRKPIKNESEEDTENYNVKRSLSRRTRRAKMSRIQRNCSRRSSYRTRATEESSEDEVNRNGEESEEKNNDEKSEKDSDNKEATDAAKKVGNRCRKSNDTSPHNVIFEKPKRLRKPVSRLTYDHHHSNAASSSDESKEEEEEDDSEEEEEQEENIENRVRRYSLREKRKPKIMTDPFEESNSHRHRKERDKLSHFLNSPARKPVFNKKYRPRATHARTLSNSSSSSDEKEFEKRKSKSMAKSRSRCLPMNLTQDDLALGSIRDRTKIGSSLADIDPMSIDTSVSFETIGGLDHHIKSLKEMIVFPLLYPEVFQKFNVTPPRGVLFYGPPGTGKTLVARALANECSHEDKKVAFFMRKGADCLSKWVGESERQLRLLFDQAYQMRPAIIFFDEIDGLAPVRSTRQDQIHSSIVSTLLALMDGLDSRGEVVVIGATNRVDAIDPALRRPGRFDREFLFPLPSSQARSQILDIHTKQWTPPPSKRLIQYLVEQTVGYCGADLKALCAEATLNALRMRYPQIYLSKSKLLLDVSKIQVKTCHFRQSLSKIVPAGQRSVSNPGRKLTKAIRPLMQPILQEVLRILKQSFGVGFNKSAVGLVSHRPRILVTGSKGQGHTTHLSPAILHAMENVPSHKLDLPSLFCVSARAPEEACAQVFLEARRNLPSIIYLPSIDSWWKTVSDTVRVSFISLLNDLESSMPLLLLATSDEPFDMLEEQVQGLFSVYRKEVFVMNNPHEDHRRHFFRPLFFTELIRKPKISRNKNRVLEELPVAPPPLPRKLNENELKKIEEVEEATLRELRIFLRQICAKLAKNRMFYIFTKPVDLHEVPDYTEVIRSPMDLETMMTKIDQHKYECAEDFLKDIDLICSNALEYNPDRNPEDKLIRHRACTLRDTAYAYIKAEMDTDFEMKCRDIRRVRVKRIQPVAGAPDFIRVGPPVTKLAAEAVAGESNKLSPDLGSSAEGGKKKHYKKRKRSSNWARGCITKKRKTDKENADDGKKGGSKENENEDQEEYQLLTEEENENVDGDDSSEAGQEDAGGESCVDSSGRVDDEAETSSDKVIVESSINLCNGNVSTEDSLDSMKISSADDFLYNKSLNEALMKETVEETMEGDEAVVSSSEPGCSGEKALDLIIDWSHLESIYDSCIACTDDATVEELHYLYTVLTGLAHKHNASTDRSPLFNEVESEIRKFAQFRVKP